MEPERISPRPLRRDPRPFRKPSTTALVFWIPFPSPRLTEGRNGCGKSTLLRLIGGAIEPVAGSMQRAGSIGTLAQLANDRLTVAQALGVSEGLACLRRLERGEGSLDDAADADWTLEDRIG